MPVFKTTGFNYNTFNKQFCDEMILKESLSFVKKISVSVTLLTISQTTDFKFFQIERVCRRQFQI